MTGSAANDVRMQETPDRRSLSFGPAPCSAFRVYPKINPVCKYVVWLVETSKQSTTNPMTKRAAMRIMKERIASGKHAGLIKTRSCVEARKLMPNAPALAQKGGEKTPTKESTHE